MPDFHLFAEGPRPVAPFSHAVEADGWVILTGQMPTDPAAPDAPLPPSMTPTRATSPKTAARRAPRWG
jgi:enamine deaminase RidA (YjgF/YER057c/UK114 family)